MKRERIIIFIDGSNFYHSINDSCELHDNEIDFTELVSNLKGDKLLIGVYYYHAALDRSYNKEIYSKQRRFFSELRRIPDFHVILCKMRKHMDARGKPRYSVKGDDIHIATDMLSGAYEDKYDTAILVSGDGDFVPAIKKVQKLGKKVENAFFKISSSTYLKEVCNSSVCLDNFIIDCLKNKNQPSVA